jgi:hypothetical protein
MATHVVAIGRLTAIAAAFAVAVVGEHRVLIAVEICVMKGTRGKNCAGFIKGIVS